MSAARRPAEAAFFASILRCAAPVREVRPVDFAKIQLGSSWSLVYSTKLLFYCVSRYSYIALQLVVSVAAEVFHCHDLDHEARPARKVLRALARACLGVVLFPCEASLFPALVDRVHEVLAQGCVHALRLLLVRAALLGDGLDALSVEYNFGWVRPTYMELLHHHVVHGHPHWAAPVVLARAIQLVFLA